MPALVRFGDFEFDPKSGELSRRGRRLPLQPQPARVLARLVERAGEMVGRDELRDLLWGDTTFVEYDQGINFAIRQLRGALGESAEHPVFIETLPRRGYRFRAPVSRADSTAAATRSEASSSSPPPLRTSEHPSSVVTVDQPAAAPEAPSSQSLRLPRIAAALAIVAAGGVAFVATRESATPERRAPVAASRAPLAAAAKLAYERGLYLARRDGPEVVARGLGELRQAVVLAPDAPEPLSALAEALLAMHRYAPSPALLAEAELVSERAVALAPDLAAAHLARAEARLLARYDWGSAELDFRRSLELDPNLAAAHRGYAAVLAASGRLDGAVTAAARARELDPVCLAASADLGWYLFLARRYDEAIAASRAALELDPVHTDIHLTLIYSHLLQGDETAALAQANAHLAAYFAKAGRPAPRAPSLEAYWHGFVEHLGAPGAEASASELALPFLNLGDEGEALRLLLAGCRERSGRDALFAAVNPLLERLQGDPRLREVVSCVGLDPDALLAPGSTRPPAVPLHGVGAVGG
jgi:DNA-binding winged helix-turn-helix (wHTH) protein/tetratricopeptide (TPR) repeat protein